MLLLLVFPDDYYFIYFKVHVCVRLGQGFDVYQLQFSGKIVSLFTEICYTNKYLFIYFFN